MGFNMQTSKIVTGDTYAIKRNGELTRFRVVEIVTRKNTGGTSSEIVGYTETNDKLTLNPADVMGPFDQFKELADKAANEKTERAKKLRRALYRLAGANVPPEKDYNLNQFFRVQYSAGVEISQDGVQALLTALETNPQLVADSSA